MNLNISNVKYTFRYQDQIKAKLQITPYNDLQIIPDHDSLKLIKTIELASLVQCSSFNLPVVRCIEKSQSFCPGCVNFKECGSTKNLNLTAVNALKSYLY